MASDDSHGRDTGSDVGSHARPQRYVPMTDPIPPVMWPDAGSGFEADPSSPAGQLQGEAMFLRGLSSDRGRVGRAALRVALGVVGIVAFSFVVTYLLQHH
jgi:hypothetical protein